MVGFSGVDAFRAEFHCSWAGPRFSAFLPKRLWPRSSSTLAVACSSSLGSFCVPRRTSRKQRLLFSGYHVALWQRLRWYSSHRLYGVCVHFCADSATSNSISVSVQGRVFRRRFLRGRGSVWCSPWLRRASLRRTCVSREDGAKSRVHEVLMQSSWVRRARRVATAGDQVDRVEFWGPCAQAQCRTSGGMDRHVVKTHRQNHHHHHHQASDSSVSVSRVSFGQNSAVAMLGERDAAGGTGSARRRRERRLRSWAKHERLSIAMALSTVTHHSFQVGTAYDALRSPKPVNSAGGMRPPGGLAVCDQYYFKLLFGVESRPLGQFSALERSQL